MTMKFATIDIQDFASITLIGRRMHGAGCEALDGTLGLLFYVAQALLPVLASLRFHSGTGRSVGATQIKWCRAEILALNHSAAAS